MSTPAFASQPANALEQRIDDLLRPYRNECFGDIEAADESAAANRAIKLERKVLVLARTSTSHAPPPLPLTTSCLQIRLLT
jgi:hypothetical protein